MTRILVVRLGAMGDIIHTLPAVASLKASFQNATIAWAVEDKWRPLLDRNPCVDQILPVDRRSFGAIVETRRRLRLFHPELALDFQGLIKSAVVAAASGAKDIVGMHRSAAREPVASFLYSRRIVPEGVHVVDRNLSLAAAAGAEVLTHNFPLPAGSREGDLPTASFVLANPLAGWQSKQWPLEHYAELASLLRDRLNMELVLNVPSFISGVNVRQHVSGLGGLIHATRQAKAIIGVDSGPLHLAAALGKSGVAIFGPTDPKRNGPYGGTMTVLRTDSAKTTYKRDKDISESMRSITPPQVLNALVEQLTKE